MDIHVSILIVNFNTSKLLKRCIESIKADQSKPQIEIFVIDNASDDDSIPMLQNTFPDVHLIANNHNYGFAKANNQDLLGGKAPQLIWFGNGEVKPVRIQFYYQQQAIGHALELDHLGKVNED